MSILHRAVPVLGIPAAAPSTRTLEIAAPALAPALAAASIGSDPYKLEPVSIGSDPYKLKPADAKAATVARTKPAQPPTIGSDPYKI